MCLLCFLTESNAYTKDCSRESFELIKTGGLSFHDSLIFMCKYQISFSLLLLWCGGMGTELPSRCSYGVVVWILSCRVVAPTDNQDNLHL